MHTDRALGYVLGYVRCRCSVSRAYIELSGKEGFSNQHVRIKDEHVIFLHLHNQLRAYLRDKSLRQIAKTGLSAAGNFNKQSVPSTQTESSSKLYMYITIIE